MQKSQLYRYLDERLADFTPRKIVQPSLHEAGVLCAITDEADPKILLTRRAMSLSSHQGEVAFPGGKRDSSDASIVATALREAQEEVALDPSQILVLTELNQVVSRFGYLVTPVLGIIKPQQTFVANRAELDAVFQVPISHFQKPPSQYFERGQMRIPSYDYQDFHIWGLTAVMIVEMLNHFWDSNISYKV